MGRKVGFFIDKINFIKNRTFGFVYEIFELRDWPGGIHLLFIVSTGGDKLKFHLAEA